MTNRREKLEAMLQDDPKDEFLRYGIAMEWRNASELDKAMEYLAGLMKDETPHVPSFLMAGQILVEQNKISDARTTLRDGIDAARAQGNAHAASEMSELLTTLGELGE